MAKQARRVLEVGGEIYLETRAGSGDYKAVTGQFAVFKWVPGGEYRLSDTCGVRPTEKAADQLSMKKWTDDAQYIVRHIRNGNSLLELA